MALDIGAQFASEADIRSAVTAAHPTMRYSRTAVALRDIVASYCSHGRSDECDAYFRATRLRGTQGLWCALLLSAV